MPGISSTFSHLISTTTLQYRHFYYSHFVDEETEAVGGKNHLAKVPLHMGMETRILTQSPGENTLWSQAA